MTYRLEHRTSCKVTTGRHDVQGAHLESGGANFALYSKHAKAVFLLFFDTPNGAPTDVIKIENCTKHVWHAHVEGIKAGQLYGFKVQGDFNPLHGFRFNDTKLLLDPYARAVTGKFKNQDNLLLAYNPLDSGKDLTLDLRDNTEIVPKSIVVDDSFDWQDDPRPNLPLEKLFIYEVHVKGYTAHRSSNVQHPGTYLGFIEKIPHLRDLGVNAVEFLPIHEYYVEDFVAAKGLTNYWGYNTLGFFAPESSYAFDRTPGAQVREFKTLVRELHRAGIEVILDVVYNHSAEGNELGPTMCLKGIDNPTYYVLTGPSHESGRYYMNHTGCGNCLNPDNRQVVRMIMDSLRYWVEVMHVDGFRFDLASVLGRREGSFRQSAPFFDAISQDPVLRRAKLIAEPWDLGTYEVGNFPLDWSEWNGRYRDTLRKFAKGDPGQLRSLGWRLAGSADLYGDDGRSAYNSVNFVTCHDGFTLNDLVSYNSKHNEANKEDNRDGSNDNASWNCGAEGESSDPNVHNLRRRLMKNHACYLLFSLGTPMILGGDEFARTQKGNNNAYCQDNELSWFDWDLAKRNADLVAFFQKAIAFNKCHTILHRRKFFSGKDSNGNGVPDVAWFGVNGEPPRWDDHEKRTLCYLLDGSEACNDLGDYRLFFILNAHHEAREIKLPPLQAAMRWHRVVDTSLPAGDDFRNPGEEVALGAIDHYLADGRSTIVLLGR